MRVIKLYAGGGTYLGTANIPDGPNYPRVIIVQDISARSNYPASVNTHTFVYRESDIYDKVEPIYALCNEKLERLIKNAY